MANKKFYDEWEFKRAHSYRTTDPYEAVAKFEEYISKYPEDYSSYIYYASNLITIGKLDEAEEVLNQVERMVKDDSKFSNNEYKLQGINFDIVFSRLRLLSYRERYEELYELLVNSKKIVDRLKLGDLLFYCKKKLGRIDPDRREPNTYLFRQIVEYRESDFLKHIEKHLSDCNVDLEDPNKNIFVSKFPIKDVMEEVKKHIPSDKKICSGFWEDTYIFKYDGCGRDNGKVVDYFKVVTFHNSCEFITICPVSGYENSPHIDLGYMIDYSDIKERNKISKIDKFNKRFKR